MIKFSTRQAARQFAAKKSTFKFVDLGAGSIGKRWAVNVI